jgi:pyruvate dehydrogenase E2 component (dihydrolipoamide acetyltransferase)
VANGLAEVPELNGFWTDEAMHIEQGIHVGFAISLRKGGLVIPAILNADMKSLEEIRTEFVDMVMRAREGHLRSSELSSATITITSLGERGAEKVYGVIYPPQVALIGFGKITEQPRAIDGSIGIRPVLSAVLAGDHRATDGHTGSRFLELFNDQLQHPDKI